MRLVTLWELWDWLFSVCVFTLCRVHWPCNCNTVRPQTRGTHDTWCQVSVSLRSGPAWEQLHGKCYHNAASSKSQAKSHWRLQGGLNTPGYYSFLIISPSQAYGPSFPPAPSLPTRLKVANAADTGQGAGPESWGGRSTERDERRPGARTSLYFTGMTRREMGHVMSHDPIHLW